MPTETNQNLRLSVGFNYIRQAFGPEKRMSPELQAKLFVIGYKLEPKKILKPAAEKLLGELSARKKRQRIEVDGPYVMLRTGKKVISVENIEQMLFIAEGNLRTALIRDVARTISRNSLGERLRAAFKDVANNTARQDENAMYAALLSLVDAMRDDFEWNLLGLRQAVRVKSNDAVDERLSRLFNLRDSSEKVQQCMLTVGTAPRQAMTEAISAIKTKAWPGKQIGVLSRMTYMLPIMPTSGIGLGLENVNLSGSANRKALNTFVRSQLRRPIPTLWFQMALICFRYSSHVDKATWKLAWARLRDLIHQSALEDKAKLTDDELLVLMHQQLLRQYFFYLETHLPGIDSDRVVHLAFELAGRIVEEIGPDKDFMRRFDRGLKPHLDRLKNTWVLSSPNYTQSHLRHVVADENNFWEALFVESLPTWEGHFQRKLIPEPDLTLISECVRRFGLDFTRTHAADGDSDEHVLAKWSKFLESPELSQWVDQSLDLLKTYSDGAAVLGAFGRFTDLDDLNQVVLLARFQQLMREGGIVLPDLWAVVTKPTFMDILRKMKTEYLDRFIYSFIASNEMAVAETKGQFAHWFAYACTQLEGDKERQSILFFGTVLIAMKTQFDSAIARAIHDDKKNALAEQRKEFSEMLMNFGKDGPAWFAGRVRAALAVM